MTPTLFSQLVVTRHNCVLSKQPIKSFKLDMNDKEIVRVMLNYSMI